VHFPSALGETHGGFHKAALRAAHFAELIDQ